MSIHTAYILDILDILCNWISGSVLFGFYSILVRSENAKRATRHITYSNCLFVAWLVLFSRASNALLAIRFYRQRAGCFRTLVPSVNSIHVSLKALIRVPFSPLSKMIGFAWRGFSVFTIHFSASFFALFRFDNRWPTRVAPGKRFWLHKQRFCPAKLAQTAKKVHPTRRFCGFLPHLPLTGRKNPSLAQPLARRFRRSAGKSGGSGAIFGQFGGLESGAAMPEGSREVAANTFFGLFGVLMRQGFWITVINAR